MRNRTLVADPGPARRYDVTPRGLAQAVAEAFGQRGERTEALLAEFGGPGSQAALEALRASGCLLDKREMVVPASAAQAFVPVRRIGGENGYFFGNVLWRIRAWVDVAVGGTGLRRGRRDLETCGVGDFIDFWCVVAFETDRRLTLAAEMKLPGRAWLQFDVVAGDGGAVFVRQTALFDPRGVLGLRYWTVLLPAHALIFRGMAEA
ncbi:MAG TPA: DUF2867 domain-containing protein [Propionicimonas sp.]|jgi:hypothetical protein